MEVVSGAAVADTSYNFCFTGYYMYIGNVYETIDGTFNVVSGGNGTSYPYTVTSVSGTYRIGGTSSPSPQYGTILGATNNEYGADNWFNPSDPKNLVNNNGIGFYSTNGTTAFRIYAFDYSDGGSLIYVDAFQGFPGAFTVTPIAGAPEMNASLIPQVGLLLGCLFFLLGRKKEVVEPMMTV